MTTYQLLIKTALGVTTQTSYSYDDEINLVELYKDAILNDRKVISYKDGILKTDDIAGIFVISRTKEEETK